MVLTTDATTAKTPGWYSVMPVSAVAFGKVWTGERMRSVDWGSNVNRVEEENEVRGNSEDVRTAMFSRGNDDRRMTLRANEGDGSFTVVLNQELHRG